MKNSDDSMRARESYQAAFHVGAGGSLVLGLGALLGDTLAWLVALALWSLVTLFVLPWLYICIAERGIELPPYVLQLLHQ